MSFFWNKPTIGSFVLVILPGGPFARESRVDCVEIGDHGIDNYQNLWFFGQGLPDVGYFRKDVPAAVDLVLVKDIAHVVYVEVDVISRDAALLCDTSKVFAASLRIVSVECG